VSRHFIQLYLDEDVDVLVAELIRARGFVAVATVAAGQRGKSDADQLTFAAASGKTLVTHNRVHLEALAAE
jgi:hypothetical protein